MVDNWRTIMLDTTGCVLTITTPCGDLLVVPMSAINPLHFKDGLMQRCFVPEYYDEGEVLQPSRMYDILIKEHRTLPQDDPPWTITEFMEIKDLNDNVVSKWQRIA
jgi:hypothetical protein